MNHQIRKNILLWTFLIIVFLPSLILVLLQQSSYLTGTLSASFSIIVFFLYQKFSGVIKNLYRSKTIFYWYFSFIIILSIHTIFALMLIGTFEFIRFFGSIFSLSIILLASYLFALIVEHTSAITFKKVMRVILLILLAIGLVGAIVDIRPFNYQVLNRPVFPFVEPSHFSLIIAPFYLWAVTTQKNDNIRNLIVLSPVIFLMFENNLTLVCLMLLAALVSFKIKRLILFTCAISILFYFMSSSLDYYSSRTDLSSSNSNISTLVWLYGWEEAYLNLKSSSGLGVGFQQFGIATPSGDVANIMYSLLDRYINRYDGGTFGSKVIGEFGSLGILLVSVLLYQSLKSLVYLRKRLIAKDNDPQLVFYHCCVSYFILELFVRSLTYVAPGLFMFLLGIIGLSLNSYKRRIMNTQVKLSL